MEPGHLSAGLSFAVPPFANCTSPPFVGVSPFVPAFIGRLCLPSTACKFFARPFSCQFVLFFWLACWPFLLRLPVRGNAFCSHVSGCPSAPLHDLPMLPSELFGFFKSLLLDSVRFLSLFCNGVGPTTAGCVDAAVIDVRWHPGDPQVIR